MKVSKIHYIWKITVTQNLSTVRIMKLITGIGDNGKSSKLFCSFHKTAKINIR